MLVLRSDRPRHRLCAEATPFSEFGEALIIEIDGDFVMPAVRE